MSDREPVEIIEHERDNEGRRCHLVKSLYKRYRKALPIKVMARAVIAGSSIGITVEPDDVEATKRWFHNKRANASNPPQRVGRTNRIKGKK